MNKQYRTCENCGANLDAGEKCDCMKSEETSKRYEVKRILGGHGVYVNSGLKMVLESKTIAERIVSLLEEERSNQ